MFSLTMSLFVAVTIVPVLCSRLLKLPPPLAERRGLSGRLYTWSERFLDGMDERYSRIINVALQHRPTVARRRHRVRRRRGHDPADDRLRADAADRRGRGPGDGRAAGRHPGRTGRGSRDPPRGAGQGVRAARPRTSSRRPAAAAGSWAAAANRVNMTLRLVHEGQADALERADRARPEPAAAGHHPRRHHPDAGVRRQPAAEPPVRRRRLPHLARDPGRRPARCPSASRRTPRR